MRKVLMMLLVASLGLPWLPTYADLPAQTEPAQLLPENTLFYAEARSAALPASFDNILNKIAPFNGEIDLAAQLLQATPYSEIQAWVGDRVAVGVFTTSDSASPTLGDYLPTAVLLLEIRDEQKAGIFLKKQGDSALRMSGYIVLGSQRGLTAIQNSLAAESASLVANTDFKHIQAAFTPQPDLWVYASFVRRGIAIYASGDQISLETARLGDPPLNGVPSPLAADAVAGVPMGALAVDTGMNLNIGLESQMEGLNALLTQLGRVTQTSLPLDMDSILRTVLGVNLEDDILPLFDGSYAAFITRRPTTAALDAGFVLTPQSMSGAGFTLVRVSNRLSQTSGVTLELNQSSQYVLEFDSVPLPDLAYGLYKNHVYVGTLSGTESIVLALDGRNLSDEPRWGRVVENAPRGTQHISYLNLREITDLLDVALRENSNGSFPVLDELISYLRRFESAAIFYRQDKNGIFLTRYSLFLD